MNRTCVSIVSIHTCGCVLPATLVSKSVSDENFTLCVCVCVGGGGGGILLLLFACGYGVGVGVEHS